MYNIFAIETSCDETAIALLCFEKGKIKVIQNIISSQIAIHRNYGGVIPELAARKHTEILQPLVEKEFSKKQLASVDIIAVTAGPGLITALMVGTQFAKSLSYSLQIPLLGIDHLEGHIYSNWLTETRLQTDSKRLLPSVILIVSGGHTQLVLMHDHGRYELLGQTLDDAVGESFDKVAKFLGLKYPGGPIISVLADKGNDAAIAFPRPLIHAKNYDFSFSGLKTAVLYHLQKQRRMAKKDLPDIAASFQRAAIDVLIAKTRRAIDSFQPKSLMLAGGVSANKLLRNETRKLGQDIGLPVFMPHLEYSGDNAAMIAAAAFYRKDEAKKNNWKTLAFYTRERLTQTV